MATSMLLRTAADQETPPETNITPEPIKTRGRKSNRAHPTQKKQPQRGLGVAQLERLRLQERWKKMTEIPHSQHQYNRPLTLSNHFHYQTPFTENSPLGSVPVKYDPPNFYGGAGPNFGGTLMVMDPYPFVVGPDPDPRLQVQSSYVLENSRELSSMPKLHCVSDRCEFCFKKKLFPLSNVGFEAVRDKNTSLENILGRKGAEVKQIHRKGNTVGGNIFMEYEFFPGKSGGTGFKELEFATEGSLAVLGGGSEACCITNTTYNGGTSSNTVDLSLKLSF